jgi:iron complex outermembrane receptor protein
MAKISRRRSHPSRLLVRRLSISLALGSAVGAAVAQGAVGGSGLQLIEVTAQKRLQSLQAVPVSVEAMGSADLERAGVRDLFNLGELSASITGGQANRTLGARMGLRGINDFARNIGYDASMGVYIDGVYAGRSESTSQSLTGMERVEVLRGPQGTLYGKNTIAGALNLTTRKPTDRFEASGSIEAGEYGTRNFGLWLGGAIVPGALQAALTLGQENSDGWIDNLTRPDLRPGSFKANNARGLLRWKPAKATTVDLSVSHYSYRGVPMFGEAVPPAVKVSFAPGPYSTSTGNDADEQVKKAAASVSVSHGLATGARLVSITAWQDAMNYYQNDEDLSPRDEIWAYGTRRNTKQITQELRYESAYSRDLDWLAGLFYMRQDNDAAGGLRIGTDFPTAAVRGLQSLSESELVSNSLAFFLHGNVRITSSLQFTGGLRYTRESKDVAFAQKGIPGFLIDQPRFTDSLTDSDVSPKAGLNWRVSDDVMVYGSVSRGFKSGGYNVDSISGTRPLNDPKVDLRFGKQTVTSTELGLKSEWMDRKIRLNAAVYSMDGTDWQVQQFITLPNGTAAPIITNAGKVRIDGAELELQARPVSSVLLKAGVAYTDARFEEFKNANAAGEAYDGRPLTFSPRLKASVSVEHLMPLGALQLRSSVSYTHTDAQWSNSNLNGQNLIPQVDLWNARVAIEGGMDARWSVALWARNLTDRVYSSFNDNSLGLGRIRGIYGQPRTVGVTLSVDL